MKISNRKTVYTVETESTDSNVVRLKGEVTINANGEVSNFSGQVMPVEESENDPAASYGSFYHSLNAGRVNQNIDVPSEYHKASGNLLGSVIEEIKTKVSE